MLGRAPFVFAGIAIALAPGLAAAHPSLAKSKSVTYEYRLRPGQCLPKLPVPAQNVPIRMIADQTMSPEGALAEAVVLRDAGATGLNWVGVPTAKKPQRHGGYATGQQPLMWVDDSATSVAVEVEDSAHVRICHKAGSSLSEAAGTLMFVW